LLDLLSFPYTTLFRSGQLDRDLGIEIGGPQPLEQPEVALDHGLGLGALHHVLAEMREDDPHAGGLKGSSGLQRLVEGFAWHEPRDRKSTRLNSSHDQI